MLYILLVVIVLAVVVFGISAVVAYFNSGVAKAKAETRTARGDLADANERVSIAQTALIEIASGDAMPVLRASDALSKISVSYTKGITK